MIGDDPRLLIHFAVRGHDKAELVHARERRKRGNKSDVLTFGGLDRAHTSVVRVVNVTDFKRRSVAVQTAGTERGEFTLVRKLRNGVGLIHELRELGRTEELADDRGNGSYVDERGRRDLHGVGGRHALLDEAFETRHTDTELILQQLAHRTHAAVAEVVDLVHRADPVLQIEVGGNCRHNVVHRNALMVELIDKGLNNLFLRRRNA